VILAREADVIIGVDTHLDTHTAAICDGRGRLVGQLQVPATAAGYARLLDWARSAAGDGSAVWAVEGTRQNPPLHQALPSPPPLPDPQQPILRNGLTNIGASLARVTDGPVRSPADSRITRSQALSCRLLRFPS